MAAVLAFVLGAPVQAADARPAVVVPPAKSEAAAPSAPPVAQEPRATPIPIASISASAEAADAALRAMEIANTVPPGVAAIAAGLDPFRRELDRAIRAGRLALAGREQRSRLADADDDLQALQGRLSDWERTLTRRSEELEGQLVRLAEMRRTWQATDELAKAGDLPRAVSERTMAVLASVERVRKRVEESRESLFALQDRLSRFQSLANEQRESLKQAMALAVGGLLARDAPPFWGDAESPAGPQAEPLPISQAVAGNLAAGYASAAEYVAANQVRMTLLLVIVLAFLTSLWAAGRQLRLRMADEPELNAAGWLFERPLAATLVATVLCSPWVLPFAPREIQLLLLAVALPATILVLRRVIDQRLAPFLYVLLVLYVLSRLLELLGAVPTLERLLFQAQMLATVAVLGWLLRRHRLLRQESGTKVILSVNWTLRGIRVAVAGFTLALLADLFGYTHLARFMADAVLGAIYTAVTLYAGVQVAYGLITLGLNLWPLQNLAMVRNLKRTIERRARRVVRWVALIVWILVTLDLAALLEPTRDTLTKVLQAQYPVGEISLSLGAALTFALTIWGALLLSRLIRFVLDEEVFSRITLQRGIPYALSTILHYMLLVGGVLVAIFATGVNLDRFTIIAGAVGVGVGFGLQGIVNNFVSGLILLFERPIKVGDSVEMANRGGQIQRIGIRACILRTGDGADIIVPNSMLITHEVTNWTLTDRQRRIEIPVGVAYGNDPERVMALLTQVAKEHEDILPQPPAETQFAGFGPNALEFKVGAWTNRPERGGSIRSELCIGIYRVLNREKIEIPYPQSTLHLASVDAGVVASLRPVKTGPAVGSAPADIIETAVPARALTEGLR